MQMLANVSLPRVNEWLATYGFPLVPEPIRLPRCAKAALLERINFFIQRGELRDLYEKVAAALAGVCYAC